MPPVTTVNTIVRMANRTPITIPVTDSAIEAFPQERADSGKWSARVYATTTHDERALNNMKSTRTNAQLSQRKGLQDYSLHTAL